MSDIAVDTSAPVDSGLAPGLITPDTSNVLPALDHKPTEDEIMAMPSKQASEPVKEVKEEVKADAPIVEEVKEEPVVDEVKDDAKEDELEPLVEIEDLSVAKINQYVKEIPELAQAFAKNPQVRNAMFAMARRSSKLGEYQAIIPTPEAAKFAAENSENFIQMNELFFAEDPQENVGFWNSLYQNSLQRDPLTNEIVKDAQGNPIETGAYQRVCATYRGAIYNELGQRAQSLPSEQKDELIKAIDLVKAYAGDGKHPSAPKVNEAELSPEIQKKLQDAERILAQSGEQSKAQQNEFQVTTSKSITTALKNDITGHVQRMVKEKGVALTPYEQKKVVDDMYNELDRQAGENPQYQSHFASLAKRAPLTEAGRESLVKEARKYAKEILPSIALKIIREATSSTVEKSETVNAKRVSQQQVKEVKTSGGAPAPEASKSLKEKARDLSLKLKRPLREDEIMALQ